jgi:thiamine kinase-like enzyme
MKEGEKINIGRKLRVFTDLMNTSCEPFNNIDIINDIDWSCRWDKYPEEFKTERISYIKSQDFGEKVFVHGDLCGDNVLILPVDELYIIDFADAVIAPKSYEQALIAVELFVFDTSLLQGYFGNYTTDEIAEVCFNGLLIHDFGGDIVDNYIEKSYKNENLKKIKTRIVEKLKY